MDLKNIKEICKDVTIVAATKYVDTNVMENLLEMGINNFGENRTEAFLSKYDVLKNKNIVWHFIGHLQRNKARDVANKIDYLHSLDSLELAKIINSIRITPLKCFVEVKMTSSETKSGIDPSNLEEFLLELKQYPNIEVIGLMAMTEKIMESSEIIKLYKEVVALGKKFNLNEFSMGMSGDYREAIIAGSTFVRLGRILFS